MLVCGFHTWLLSERGCTMRMLGLLTAGAMVLGGGAEAQAGLLSSKKLKDCPVVKYLLKNSKLKKVVNAVKKPKSSKKPGK